MKFLSDWLDQRTGFRRFRQQALYKSIPGGSRWRYVWGSTLTFAFFIQVVTGFALWAGYAPSAHTAWESVFHLQNDVPGGWFLRGLHHYTAQAMTILLVLHLMQVVIDGAYKAPRELNFWFGVILLLLVLALSLTGYLLPWDQRGFWASKVAASIIAVTPGIGLPLQRVLIGGTNYGNETLTRFFALHAGVLPATVIFLIVLHIYLFRRSGITTKKPLRGPAAAYWPDQILKDIVACLAVLAAILVIIISQHGARLGPPADPTNNFSAARPEWYFLFLYQFLKYFPGDVEAIGAIWIPGAVILLIFLMPFIGRWKLGHRFNVGFLFCLLAGIGFLTWQAIADDRGKPEVIEAIKDSDQAAERIKVLAESTGIPVEGALSLLQQDPLTQGPRLFAKYCASCHRFGGEDGLGHAVSDPETASDLKGFGSRAWVGGLLDPAQIGTARYFGATAMKNGRMAKYVKNKVGAFTADHKADLAKVILAVSSDAQLKAQQKEDATAAAEIKAGRALFSEDFDCNQCHQFHNTDDSADAPNLTDYASRAWLISFIGNPKQDKYYGKRNDRMPAFAVENILDAKSIALLADWLRGDWTEPGQLR
jgi:ubiquinol-cytochrome c reductase cytochrome b subunit